MRRKILRPLRILIVDDNPGDVRLLMEGLKLWSLPHEVDTASDGEKALKSLYSESSRPDLIFLDLNMPKKGGIEVLNQIKAEEKLKSIPVIILTTSNAQSDVTNSYQAHANSYIVKPIDVDALLNEIAVIENYWCNMVTLPSE